MAKNVDQDKRVTVSGTVTPGLHEAIEAYRWPNRMSRSDVVNAALIEYGEKHLGYTEPKTGEADAEGAEETQDAAPEESGPQTPAPAETGKGKATARRAG